jgi:hypothetical protein
MIGHRRTIWRTDPERGETGAHAFVFSTDKLAHVCRAADHPARDAILIPGRLDDEAAR